MDKNDIVCSLFSHIWFDKTRALAKARDYDSSLWRELTKPQHVLTTSTLNTKLIVAEPLFLRPFLLTT
jgi:hypothetical protein